VRVLVVEDKVKLAAVLSRGLRKEGLSADVTATVRKAVSSPAGAADVTAP
jgi:DNA-binding response OmpR family regulator